MVDDVLHNAVRGITDLVVLPGLINLDFADVKAIIKISGRAMMGSGQAEGEGRAVSAAEAAIANPLLDIASVKGAQGVLINITGGADMTLFEVDQAATRVRAEVDPNSVTIFGSTYSQDMDGKIRVSIVATGLQNKNSHSVPQPELASVLMEEVGTIAEEILLTEDDVVTTSDDPKDGMPEAVLEDSNDITGPIFDKDMALQPEPNFEELPPLPSAFTEDSDADTFDPFSSGTQLASGDRNTAQAKRSSRAFAWLTGRGHKHSED